MTRLAAWQAAAPVAALGLAATLGLVAALWPVADAWAQSGTPLPPPGEKQIEAQERGQYPALNGRSTVPLGAINTRWAEDCGQEGTTVAVAHSPSREITFRVRQLLGTVVTFPEAVELVTAPAGSGFTAEAYGPQGTRAAPVWVFGTANAGIDGNFIFVGTKRRGYPVLYTLHVQAEGFNTHNCPDLVVLVKPPVSDDLDGIARVMDEWARAVSMTHPFAPNAPVDHMAGVSSVLDGEDPMAVQTGRGETDYIEGKGFDPTALSFDWTVRGEAELAPDVVYSDCCSTYLKFYPDRIDKVRTPAVSAVVRTANGQIDTPVNWTFKGDTIVVQGIQKLTLEYEGLVTCIDPGASLTAAAPAGVIRAAVEPIADVNALRDEGGPPPDAGR